MDFFLPNQDPNIERFPPEKVAITRIGAEAYPDGQRVKIALEMTPFEKRPHIEVSLLNNDGNEVSSASIIEPIAWKLDFTMHIRSESTAGAYTIIAQLFYPDGPQADLFSHTFEIPPVS